MFREIEGGRRLELKYKIAASFTNIQSSEKWLKLGGGGGGMPPKTLLIGQY